MSTLEHAIAAWRQTKHPRFALVAKWALERALEERPRAALVDETWNAVFGANDPLDVPRLIDALASSRSVTATVERVKQLQARSDPNVVTGIIGLLEALPEALRATASVFRACVRLLEHSKDSRARAGLEVARERFATVLYGAESRELTALAHNVLSKWAVVPHDESMSEVAARLEAMFSEALANERAAQSALGARRATDDALLAAIYAAPDDDSPRMVFADALTERGDPRGEFINLQLARARGPVSDEAVRREYALRAKRWVAATWGLPLSQGGHVELRRGFPWWLTLEERTVSTIVGSPALRLLERVDGFDVRMSPAIERALLNCEELRDARQVNGISSAQLARLERDRRWQSIEIADQRFNIVHLKHLQALRAVQLTVDSTPSRGNPLEALPHLRRLSLDIQGQLPLGAWLEDLPRLEELSLRSGEALLGLDALRALPTLRTLQIRSGAEVLLPELRIESLTLPNGDPLRIIEELSTVKHLHFVDAQSVEKVPAFLRQRAEVQSISFNSFELVKPFTEHGFARISPSPAFFFEKTQGPLIEALRALSDAHVRRIEIAPRHSERFLLEDEAAMKALGELARANSVVPVIRRWQ